MKKLIALCLCLAAFARIFAHETERMHETDESEPWTTYYGFGAGGVFALGNANGATHTGLGVNAFSFKDVSVKKSNGLALLFGTDVSFLFNKDLFDDISMGVLYSFDLGIGKAFSLGDKDTLALMGVIGYQSTGFDAKRPYYSGDGVFSDECRVGVYPYLFAVGVDVFYNHTVGKNWGFFADIKAVGTVGSSVLTYSRSYKGGGLAYSTAHFTLGFDVIPSFGISVKLN